MNTLLSAALLSALALSAARAQSPKVGSIELYGLRKVDEAKVRRIVNVQAGDPLPPKVYVEETLEKLPNVTLAKLEAVCCEGPNATLFVGIEEKGGRHFTPRTAPTGEVNLPDEAIALYQSYLSAVANAARRGSRGESLVDGHALHSDPATFAIQQRMIEWSSAHTDELKRVIRESGSEAQRAAAACLIGYVSKKRIVVDELQLGVQDPDEAVRANATRSLMAFAVLAKKDAELGVRVAPTWFVEMLNSVSLSDRMQAARMLALLTEDKDPKLLDLIKDRSLPAVLEMARWKNPEYALPAYLIAGRISGLPDETVQQAWKDDKRGPVLAAIKPVKRRRIPLPPIVTYPAGTEVPLPGRPR